MKDRQCPRTGLPESQCACDMFDRPGEKPLSRMLTLAQKKFCIALAAEQAAIVLDELESR